MISLLTTTVTLPLTVFCPCCLECTSGGYGGVILIGEITYDTCMPSLHTYLGDSEEKHHRAAFLDGGAVLNLPLFCLDGVVLFPGATLPLRVIGSNFVAAIERALNQVNVPYTIAVIQVRGDPANHRMNSAGTGTTAEIRQYGRLEDGSLNVVTCGQQRFRLRRCWIDVEGVTCGEIQIIEEDIPSRTPRGAFGKLTRVSNLPRSHATSSVLPSRYSPVKVRGSENGEYDSEESFESELSLKERRIHQSIICSSYEHDLDESSSSGDDKFAYESDQEIRSNLKDSYILRSLLSDHGKDAENLDSRIGNCSTSGKQFSVGKELSRCYKNIDAYSSHRISRAFWPHWVYRMFDSYCLAQRAADMWKQIVGVPSMDALAKKPDVLSFYIASKIPVSVSTKQELLDIDGISHRLRREIELLENIALIRCKSCQTTIAKRSDMLVMSSEGPLGASVNPSGYVHEIMTLFKTNGLALTGPAVTKYSWFPGYQRTIANCATCETQMGWFFTAKNEKLKPRSFWGIRNCRVAEEMR
ncbi:uncharacterized protein LOC133315631 isoform X2 [Gastrolobium bilobum]|uniref:uncharacterized protein LOC133315631 isoform X2 n=1 Tax=Gastrolobium bilobum TaxID=150636 RepID=UPI002AB159B5|nr:uncharacterized protein LOC133315631 isoform X2 [Gastrolobium bilobum]